MASAPPSQPPDDDRFSDDPPLPRWALWLMLPGMIAPLLIFGFIVTTQRAHDESRCAYREIERRSIAADASVVEDGRSCVTGVEERRFSLVRANARRVLGERRFETQAFAGGHYRWTALQTQEGEAQVTVHNHGHEDVLFREGTAEERRKGISRRHALAGEAGGPGAR